MQNKKVTMLAAVLAVTVIAMAGVGYAAVTQYTATTTNTANTMDVTHITLTQDGAAYENNFLTDLYFDSVNVGPSTGPKTVFTPVLTGKLDGTSYSEPTDKTAWNATLISKDLTLKVTPTGTAPGGVKLLISADTSFTPNANLIYTMVVGNKAVAYGTQDVDGASFTGWVVDSIATGVDVKVQLVVQLNTSGTDIVTVGDVKGLLEAKAISGFPKTGETGTTFTFKAVADVPATTTTTQEP